MHPKYGSQLITSRLINSADGVRKGRGNHLDLAVLSLQVGVCSCFGLPWLAAATVRSVAHLRSLTDDRRKPPTLGDGTCNLDYDDDDGDDNLGADGADGADGGYGGYGGYVSVGENRLTGFAIHVAIGVALLAGAPLLRVVPLPALAGLFAYMGATGLQGNAFVERLRLLLTDPARLPDTELACKVSRASLAKVTAVQCGCLVALYVIKESVVGILFPLLIAVLHPIRQVLGASGMVSDVELHVLDPDQISDQGGRNEGEPPTATTTTTSTAAAATSTFALD